MMMKMCRISNDGNEWLVVGFQSNKYICMHSNNIKVILLKIHLNVSSSTPCGPLDKHILNNKTVFMFGKRNNNKDDILLNREK